MITLKTLKDATEQEVFDQVARHLLTQNEKSMIGSGCMYRGERGLSCAAGCLISDEEYDGIGTCIESQSWEEVSCIIGNASHWELIDSLQLIHDSFETKEWMPQLLYCAAQLGLSTKVIDQFKSQRND